MNNKAIVKILSPFLILSLAACASVNSVSLTPIPASRQNKVEASAKRWIFLAFNFDNDFIDPVVEDLKSKCPNGVVSGILTKDETYSYFLVFRKQLTATGYCNEPRKITASSESEGKVHSSKAVRR